MTNLKTIFLAALTLMLIAGWGFAADDFNYKLDWPKMIMELLGGLALFLFGLDLLIKSLLAVAGEKMKHLLEKLTVNRVTGAISGTLVTAVIQSSSVTTVLVVGFVSAGLMTVVQAASVIMGANLGTTITAQIVAFKITNLALLMIAIGFVMQFVGQRSRTRSFGELILGLGLIFFGMNVMSEGMAPFPYFSYSNFDGAFNAFHRDAITHLLPYHVTYEHVNWQESQKYLILEADIKFQGQVLYNLLITGHGTLHRPYPRNIHWHANWNKVLRDLRESIDKKYHNEIEVLPLEVSKRRFDEIRNPLPPRAPIVPYRHYGMNRTRTCHHVPNMYNNYNKLV